MVKLQLLVGVAYLALFLTALISVITTPEGHARHLPRWAWLLLVLFFPFVGSVAWLAVGRPRSAGPTGSAHERAAPSYPEYDRPGRAAAVDAAGDDEFLRQVRARAEEQRRRHDQQRREAQQSEEAERAERARRRREGEKPHPPADRA